METKQPIISCYLDDTRCSSHTDKVSPLQDGSEAALQHDDTPQHLLVEKGLQTLAFRLPQEHLALQKSKNCAWVETKKERKKKVALRNTHHGVAHLVPGWKQVNPSEEFSDARLSGARSPRQQHMKVANKLLNDKNSSRENTESE